MANATATPSPKPALFGTVAGWLLSILLALMFVTFGSLKLAGRPNMVQEFSRVGLGQWFRYFTGVLEVIGGAGILIPRFSRLAALLLAVVLIGAITAHLTVLRPLPPLPVVLLGLALMTAWLRR